MVRGGAKKEENAGVEERKKLKRLALKNNLLSERQASSSGSHALSPSKIVMKHHGKDIMRKSQRSGKSRFLFSFPGLLAPITGGKIGELKDLGTKNPILYLDFPQGQMKLFGTIVYPKNRYLTLQFSRSGKNVMCEDYFDNMIVFSDAWWIGRKDENPDEARLEFPSELTVDQLEYDFKGGAGAPCDKKPVVSKSGAKLGEEQSPKRELEEISSDIQDNSKEFAEVTPTRHSARMAGKTFKFAEASSGDDFVENGGETSEEEEEKADTEDVLKHDGYKKRDSSHRVVLDIDMDDAQICTPDPEKRKQAAKSASKTKERAQSNKGPLVQASISTLFEKAGKRGDHTDVKEKKDDFKVSGSRRKGKAIEEKKAGTENTVKKKKAKVQLTLQKKINKEGLLPKSRFSAPSSESWHCEESVEADDDDIEEFTSTSQENIESSDDDWVA